MKLGTIMYYPYCIPIWLADVTYCIPYGADAARVAFAVEVFDLTYGPEGIFRSGSFGFSVGWASSTTYAETPSAIDSFGMMNSGHSASSSLFSKLAFLAFASSWSGASSISRS